MIKGLCSASADYPNHCLRFLGNYLSDVCRVNIRIRDISITYMVVLKLRPSVCTIAYAVGGNPSLCGHIRQVRDSLVKTSCVLVSRLVNGMLMKYLGMLLRSDLPAVVRPYYHIKCDKKVCDAANTIIRKESCSS